MTAAGWRRAAISVAVAAVACGGPGPRPSTPSAPVGPIPASRLQSMLLQPTDLPGLGSRRVFASADLTTQATPQLALCRAPAPAGPHEVANVIAEVARPGGVKTFEVLSAFTDGAAALAAFVHDGASARLCPSYSVDGIAHRVAQLATVDFGAGTDGLHYALVTADVVSGDVRTYAHRGRYTVLLTGFGAPPTGQSLLAYQHDVMQRALARLR